jgi:hypothetical protein
MTLATMKELFGVAHIRDDEEEVPVPQGPSIAVPPKGRGCLVAVDDNSLYHPW